MYAGDEAAFAIVDVSDWEALGPEPTGSKPNLWVADSDGMQWLFKERTSNPAQGGERYPRGDDWAEKIAAEVGTMLGVPTAHVELAKRGEVAGVISRRVHRPDEQLWLGNQVLARWDNQYPTKHGPGIAEYTVANVVSALRSLPALAPPGPAAVDGIGMFAGYLVLDAVIGNTDRHHSNWAVIRGADGSMRLSPSFDHASSLGFAITDAERARFMKSSDPRVSPKTFAGRARTPFAGRPHPCAVAVDALEDAGRDVAQEWVAAVNELSERWAEVERTVARLPDRVSDRSRRFALALLKVNAQRFLSQATGTL